MAEKKTDTDAPVKNAEPKTLAEESGVDARAAAQAIADMTRRFEAQQAEMRKLQETVVTQQAQIGKLSLGRAPQAALEIVHRNCNVCGKEPGPNGRCPNPKHKRAQVNEVAFGVKHNRNRPFIVRQV